MIYHGFVRRRKVEASRKKNEGNWNKQGTEDEQKSGKEAKINWIWKIRVSVISNS